MPDLPQGRTLDDDDDSQSVACLVRTQVPIMRSSSKTNRLGYGFHETCPWLISVPKFGGGHCFGIHT